MEDHSEQAIKANCPHCDPSSHAFAYLLEQTENFYIVCDAHPIIEGHILIIPKQHISCIGAYSKELFREFLILDEKVSQFLLKEYKAISSFEHGILGQTVFHSHIHYLPFSGKPTDIVLEGEDKIDTLTKFSELQAILEKSGGYLFFSIGKNKWTVNPAIAAPRFFRDRFANSFGRPERGNWKIMIANKKLTEKGNKEDLATKDKWDKFFR